MSALTDLIARLEGPDAFWTITTDVEIAETVGAKIEPPVVIADLVSGEPAAVPPSYGQSVDAALTLVPPGWRVSQLNELPRIAGRWIWRVELRDFSLGESAPVAMRADGETAPVALSLAALKAIRFCKAREASQ
jgi:hypothetical protein